MGENEDGRNKYIQHMVMWFSVVSNPFLYVKLGSMVVLRELRSQEVVVQSKVGDSDIQPPEETGDQTDKRSAVKYLLYIYINLYNCPIYDPPNNIDPETHRVTEESTMWGPPVIRWVINPMNTIVIGTINHSY